MSSPPRPYPERGGGGDMRRLQRQGGGGGPASRDSYYYHNNYDLRRRPGDQSRRRSPSLERRRGGRSRERLVVHHHHDMDGRSRRHVSSLGRRPPPPPLPQQQHQQQQQRSRSREYQGRRKDRRKRLDDNAKNNNHQNYEERRDRRELRPSNSPNYNINNNNDPSSSRRRQHRRKRARRKRSYSPPPRRSLSYSSSSRGSSSPKVAGVVSDDEDVPRRGGNESPQSVHDDTVGHFNGGRGTILADRYRVLSEVGVGTFGRVLQCIDLERSRSRSTTSRNHERREKKDDCYCAIKIVRKVKRYYDSAIIEARIIRDVNRRDGRGRTHCVILHDSFTLQGHYCMVFENLGPSLYDFLKRHNYQPFPMVCVQDFAVQLLETIEFLHSFRLIHTDLKIENILLMNDREIAFDRRTKVPERTKIKLIDFGGACYDDSKKSTIINTRQYRAPEVILATGWSMPSDMWSLGCILAELYQGELLFPTHSNVEHLALMERTIGPFPRRMLKNANELADEAFDANGSHRMERVLSAENDAFVRKSPTLEDIVRRPEDRWFLKLLRQILVLDPQERATAHESLKYLGSVRRCHVRYA